MNVAGLRSIALETQSMIKIVRGEQASFDAGAVVVSGMLAEQLARELAAGAHPGSVVVSEGTSVAGAQVAVRVIAGEPSEADDLLVRTADRAGVPVVLVQLWPQAEWETPFVLSPFVVECRTGEGFPIGEITRRIAEAVDHPTTLAARIPVLKEPVAAKVERDAILHAALIVLVGARKPAARPLLVFEQVRMLGQLHALESPEERSEELPVVAGVGAATLAASYGFRAAARSARRVLPAPLADAVVAAAGTWALARALRQLENARS